jgi:hypothetical protein
MPASAETRGPEKFQPELHSNTLSITEKKRGKKGRKGGKTEEGRRCYRQSLSENRCGLIREVFQAEEIVCK